MSRAGLSAPGVFACFCWFFSRHFGAGALIGPLSGPAASPGARLSCSKLVPCLTLLGPRCPRQRPPTPLISGHWGLEKPRFDEILTLYTGVASHGAQDGEPAVHRAALAHPSLSSLSRATCREVKILRKTEAGQTGAAQQLVRAERSGRC